jgi:hypothetical protein
MNSKQVAKELEAAMILQEMSTLVKSAPSVTTTRKRKYSSTNTITNTIPTAPRVNATVHGFQMHPTTRAVTPPSINERTASPPPSAPQQTIAVVSPNTSPDRIENVMPSAITISLTPKKKQIKRVKNINIATTGSNIKPLAAPPRMHVFSNFNKNANLQTLSLLSKKNTKSCPPPATRNLNGNTDVNVNATARINVTTNFNSTTNVNSTGIASTSSLEAKKAYIVAAMQAERLRYNNMSSSNSLSSNITTGTSLMHQQIQQSQIRQDAAITSAPIYCYPTGLNSQGSQSPIVPLTQLQVLPFLTKKVLPSSTTTTKSNKIKSSPTKKRKICKMEDCEITADKRTPYCINHRGQRKCESKDCDKFAQSKTRFCIKHGGGRRCTFPNCNKGARDKFYCGAHGGGKRCSTLSCPKLAVGGDSKCTAHGGGKRCQEQNCSKSAQSSSNFCVRHGGGRKCKMDGCQKVARGKMGLCMSHATATTKEQQL